MKEVDRYTQKLCNENTFIGEWKGDSFGAQKVRVTPDGMFTFGGSPLNQAGGDMWVDLNTSEVDFAAGDVHMVGPYRFGHPDRVDLTNTDGSASYMERLSDYNPKFATNGH